MNSDFASLSATRKKLVFLILELSENWKMSDFSSENVKYKNISNRIC